MFSAHIARQSDLGGFLHALNGYLAERCRDRVLSQRASIVIEELVVNAFSHGGAERAGGVGVEIAVEGSDTQGSNVQGSVWHDGAPFDPSATPPAEAEAVEDATGDPMSGRGLRLVHAFTRSLAHTRTGDTNAVRFEIDPS